MHDPVLQTGKWLKSVVQGYFNYYAVPGNLDEPGRLSGPVAGLMVANLRRRSQQRRLPGPNAALADVGYLNRVCSILTPRSLRRHSSAIRTGCANERPSGSVEGVASNRYPYPDLTIPK